MNVLPYRVFYDGHKYFAKEAHPECFTPNRIFRSKYHGIISCNVWARHSEEAIQEAERLIKEGE